MATTIGLLAFNISSQVEDGIVETVKKNLEEQRIKKFEKLLKRLSKNLLTNFPSSPNKVASSGSLK